MTYYKININNLFYFINFILFKLKLKLVITLIKRENLLLINKKNIILIIIKNNKNLKNNNIY